MDSCHDDLAWWRECHPMSLLSIICLNRSSCFWTFKVSVLTFSRMVGSSLFDLFIYVSELYGSLQILWSPQSLSVTSSPGSQFISHRFPRLSSFCPDRKELLWWLLPVCSVTSASLEVSLLIYHLNFLAALALPLNCISSSAKTGLSLSGRSNR